MSDREAAASVRLDGDTRITLPTVEQWVQTCDEMFRLRAENERLGDAGSLWVEVQRLRAENERLTKLRLFEEAEYSKEFDSLKDENTRLAAEAAAKDATIAALRELCRRSFGFVEVRLDGRDKDVEAIQELERDLKAALAKD